MYFYFDSQDKLRTSISHGEIPRQGSTINIYLCFDEDRFDDIYNKVSDYVLQVSFTLPDGTQTQTEHLSLSNGYLGLEIFNKLTDSEMTFDLKPGFEYHTFKKSFYSSSAISQVYGKVTMHIAFYKNEEYLYTENGTFYVERTIGNKRTTSTITPGEYEALNTLINQYIVQFEQITFVTDVESLESVTNPDTRHIYRLRNADGKLEYYNYKKDYGWHRFVTGEEFENLSEKVDSNEDRIETLEETSEEHDGRIETLEEASEDHSGRIGTLENTSTQHGSRIESLETTSSQHSGRIEELENTSEEQAEKIITLEEVTNQHTSKIEKNKTDIKTVSDRITTEENTRKTSDENLQKNIDAESNKRESDDANLQEQITINSNNLNKKINLDFSGIGVAPSLHKDDTIVIRCNGTTYTITIDELASLINSEVDYFKGVHASLDALREAHPTGEPGDYAFVGGTGSNEQVVQYVWDKHENRWEETITTQYVGTSTFETFQQRLQDGSIHVGAVKANVNNTEESDPLLVNIEVNGEKFIIPNVALDFLGEPVKDAYKLGAIKINGDVWNINNDIVDFEISDENMPDGYELGSIIINGTKWNVLKLSDVQGQFEEFKDYLDSISFNKGEFLSLEALQSEHPFGKPGDFAFVNTPTDQGDIMLMYIWDDDSGVWKETTSNQYVSSYTFEEFKQELEDRLNNFSGGGGVEFIFNANDFDSTKIYEVPIFYDSEFYVKHMPETTRVDKVYLNKKLPSDFVQMLVYYAFLSDGLLDENGNYYDQAYYFAEHYDENTGEYYDLGIGTYPDGNFEIFYDKPYEYVTLFDTETGWHDNAPDYIEFGVDMYSYNWIEENMLQRLSKLFFTLLSQIFSFNPFDDKEFDAIAIRKDYYHLGFNTFDMFSYAWEKINGGDGQSSGNSCFIDVDNLNTVENIDKKAIYRIKKIGIAPEPVKSAIPMADTGEKFTKIYINTSLSEEKMFEIANSVHFVGASYNYKYLNIIHANGTLNESNGGIDDKYALVIEYDNWNLDIVVYDFVNYNDVHLYHACVSGPQGGEEFYGWNPNINQLLNEDGSIPVEVTGTEVYPQDYHNRLYLDIGLENDKLIDLFYTYQPSETPEDYEYYQYTSRGWERYGTGVIVVDELPSLELPEEFIPIPNEGKLCKLSINTEIYDDELLAVFKSLPEEAWTDNKYYICDLTVIGEGQTTPSTTGINLYFYRQTGNTDKWIYYFCAQSGSSFADILYVTDENGYINFVRMWDIDYHVNEINHLLESNNEYLFNSVFSFDSSYTVGKYNDLLIGFISAFNPEYNPDAKPIVSQNSIYRIDDGDGSKYYNYNGKVWNEFGSGGGSNVNATVEGDTLTLEIGGTSSGGNGIGGSSSGSSVTVDTSMSDTSTNPVQNKVIKEYIDNAVSNLGGTGSGGVYSKAYTIEEKTFDGAITFNIDNQINDFISGLDSGTYTVLINIRLYILNFSISTHMILNKYESGTVGTHSPVTSNVVAFAGQRFILGTIFSFSFDISEPYSNSEVSFGTETFDGGDINELLNNLLYGFEICFTAVKQSN